MVLPMGVVETMLIRFTRAIDSIGEHDVSEIY